MAWHREYCLYRRDGRVRFRIVCDCCPTEPLTLLSRTNIARITARCGHGPWTGWDTCQHLA
jgi:hypothetical protein